MSLNQQREEGVTVVTWFTWVINAAYRETEALLYCKVMKEYVWKTRDPLGCLPILLWPWRCELPTGNNPWFAYVPSEGKGSIEWMVWRLILHVNLVGPQGAQVLGQHYSGCACEGALAGDYHLNWQTEESKLHSALWVVLFQWADNGSETEKLTLVL